MLLEHHLRITVYSRQVFSYPGLQTPPFVSLRELCQFVAMPIPPNCREAPLQPPPGLGDGSMQPSDKSCEPHHLLRIIYWL